MTQDAFRAIPFGGRSIEPPPDADAEQLRRACKSLQERIAFLRQVLSSIYAGLIVTDAGGSIRSVNQAMVGMLGHSEEQLLGRDLRSLLLKSESPSSGDFVGEILAFEDAQVLRSRDGSNVDVMMSPTVLFDERGNVRCVVCTFLDVTEHKKLESEVRQIQHFEAIGALAAGIAHEIGTPLQYIATNARYLSEVIAQLVPASGSQCPGPATPPGGDPLSEVVDACGSIEEGVRRIADLVSALREHAHPTLNGRTEADVNAAIRRCLTIARHEYRLVASVYAELGEIPSVHCNVGELSRVFLNLIVNAAHAIEQAVGQTRQRGRIVVRSWTEPGHVVVSIADDGTGIPESIRNRVFDRFFTTKGVGRGTGQGLAVAREIVVEKHRGTLTFETQEGRGTTFFVRLPLRASEAEETEPPPELKPANRTTV